MTRNRYVMYSYFFILLCLFVVTDELVYSTEKINSLLQIVTEDKIVDLSILKAFTKHKCD